MLLPSGAKVGSPSSFWCCSLGFLTSTTPPPPETWNSQISPVPSERPVVKCFLAAMNRPSGLHEGWLRSRKSSFETWRLSEPSAFMIQILSPPPRSEVKAMRRPSGEKRGCTSQARPSAMRVGAPPPIGMT